MKLAAEVEKQIPPQKRGGMTNKKSKDNCNCNCKGNCKGNCNCKGKGNSKFGGLSTSLHLRSASVEMTNRLS